MKIDRGTVYNGLAFYLISETDLNSKGFCRLGGGFCGLGQGPGLPGCFIIKEIFKESMVEGMARLMGDNMTQDRHTEQRKIPDAVQQFMPNKLIVKSQSFLV
jgi:hypothetical protein